MALNFIFDNAHSETEKYLKIFSLRESGERNK